MNWNKIHKIISAFLFFTAVAFADVDSDIRDLLLQKETLNGEIQKLNVQIASTDSMLKADDKRMANLKTRYTADVERRKAEIDSLNAKVRRIAGELQTERGKQIRAKNRSENVKAKRKALNAELATLSHQLESQIELTLPWEKENRLERVRSLIRDIESGNATEEEAFSRLKVLIAEEIKFGDEVVMINSPLTRKNGDVINAQILRVGNQWMVYSDEGGTVYGTLVRSENGKTISFEWNEDLNLAERGAIRNALDVKLAKKPPQMVVLPVSLSVLGGKK